MTGLGCSLTPRRARELLARLGLDDKARSYPARLSGGQQQGVAIALLAGIAVAVLGGVRPARSAARTAVATVLHSE